MSISQLFSELLQSSEPFSGDGNYIYTNFAGPLTSNQNDRSISFRNRNFEIDIAESETHIEIYALLPHVDSNTINIDFFNNKMIISATRDEYQSENLSYHMREIKRGDLRREITLPISVTSRETVSINFTNGLLHIRLSKQREEQNRFSIAVDETNVNPTNEVD
jgi:HSP20 family molecular chaperone IbpA